MAQVRHLPALASGEAGVRQACARNGEVILELFYLLQGRLCLPPLGKDPVLRGRPCLFPTILSSKIVHLLEVCLNLINSVLKKIYHWYFRYNGHGGGYFIVLISR